MGKIRPLLNNCIRTYGGKAYTLPHLPALQAQYDEYRLLEPVTGREGKLYEPLIRAIVMEEIINE